MRDKFIFSTILILLVLISSVLAGQVGIASLPSVNSDPGTTASFSVTINNTGAGDLATVTIVSTALTSGSKTITAPSITSINNLVSGTNQTRTFTISVPFTQSGTYTGTLTATNALDTSNKASINYNLNVNSLDALDILTFTIASPLTLRGEEKDVITQAISVKNIGSTDLTLTGSEFIFTAANFKDSDGDAITLTFSDIGTITPGNTGTSTLTVNIANKVDLDTYSGIIELKDTTTSKNDTFKLEVSIQPEVCEDGVRKDGNVVDSSSALIQLSINEPDNNDEFAPGEVIDIEVNVENEDDDAMDVVVEAFLYNLDEDNEIERVKSESIEIDDGDDDDFNFELTVPKEDLDEDDTYLLFVKAYEDGNEDENCNEDSIDIDIERDDHNTIIQSFTVNPLIVSCSDLVSFSVDVKNIGSKGEDDVFIEVKQPELQLDEESDLFDLDSDDDAVRRFTFTMPENAQEKDYTVEAVVTFDDNDERSSEFATLKVSGCSAVEPESEFLQGSVSIGDLTFSETQASLPVTVTNNADVSGAFEVKVINIGSWANPVDSKTVTLEARQSTTIFFYPQLKEDLPERATATVSLISNSNIVDSKGIEKDITKASTGSEITGAITGVFNSENIGTVFWIVADIVLIILAVWLIKALFTRKK